MYKNRSRAVCYLTVLKGQQEIQQFLHTSTTNPLKKGFVVQQNLKSITFLYIS